MKNLGKLVLLLTIVFILFNTCNRIQVTKKQTIVVYPKPTITIDSVTNYHQDKEFEYEYRTGTSGHYQYNYDVIGSTSHGDSVSGNVNVEGKYGKGFIINKEGSKISITTEWIGHGKLSAVDTTGTTYQLITE